MPSTGALALAVENLAQARLTDPETDTIDLVLVHRHQQIDGDAVEQPGDAVKLILAEPSGGRRAHPFGDELQHGGMTLMGH